MITNVFDMEIELVPCFENAKLRYHLFTKLGNTCQTLQIAVSTFILKMDDPERLSATCDVVIDHLLQQRKNRRPRKGTKVVLSRDGTFNFFILIIIH